MRYYKVRLYGSRIIPQLSSYELVTNEEYFILASDFNMFKEFVSKGFAPYNYYYFVNLDFDIKDDYVIEIVAQVKDRIREDKLNLLFDE